MVGVKQAIYCIICCIIVLFCYDCRKRSQKELNALLFQAIEKDNFEEVKNLIKEGADVNARHFPGKETPLIAACMKGNFKIIKFLVNHGADVNAVDRRGMSALQYAIYSKNALSIVKFLVNQKLNISHFDKHHLNCVYDALVEQKYQIVKLLIAKGFPVRYSDNKYGYTVLMLACISGNKEIVKLILEKGVRVNLRSKDGRTALDWAIFHKKYDLIPLLRKYGAKTAKELEEEKKLKRKPK